MRVCGVLEHTDDHPDSEVDPRGQIQLHHEVDVDEHAEQWQPGQQRDLQEKWKWHQTRPTEVTSDPRLLRCDIKATLKVRASLLSGCLQMMTTQTAHIRPSRTQGTTTEAWPNSSPGRQWVRTMHRMVMRSAEGGRVKRAGLAGTLLLNSEFSSSVCSCFFSLHSHNKLTDDGGGDVDDGAGHLRRDVATGDEEQLEGKVLPAGRDLHLRVIVTAVAVRHLLALPHLHQLLRLATGGAEVPGLVPAWYRERDEGESGWCNSR